MTKTFIKDKVKEMNEQIGAELAVSLMHRARAKAWTAAGAFTLFCPCCCIPATIYTKTCSSSKEIVKLDTKIVNDVNKRLKTLVIHAKDISNKDSLIDDQFLKGMTDARSQEVKNLLEKLNHLKTEAAQIFYGSIPQHFQNTMNARKSTDEIVQLVQKRLG